MISQLSTAFSGHPAWLAVACGGTALLAYFLGCFNGAVVVSRYILRDDVRTHGSGNAGLTNFHRVFGGPLTAVVILSDVLKAVIAALFSAWIFGILSPGLAVFGKYWAGFFCMLGHMFPCMFQFKGGKGILSCGALTFVIDWRLALICWGSFLVVSVLTRFVSLGSCVAALAFFLTTIFFFRDPVLIVIGAAIAALILWKHRGNIKRLAAGTEPKFTLHKPADPAPAARDEEDQP